MYPFSETTLNELFKAGWTPERQIDTKEYERLLRDKGYVVHPVVVDFLRSFGGLKMMHENGFGVDDRDLFHFNIKLALSETCNENVQADAELVGFPLCLIGEMFSGDLWLTMDATGKVYASDLSIRLVGDSGADAIEAICTTRPVRGLFC